MAYAGQSKEHTGQDIGKLTTVVRSHINLELMKRQKIVIYLWGVKTIKNVMRLIYQSSQICISLIRSQSFREKDKPVQTNEWASKDQETPKID